MRPSWLSAQRVGEIIRVEVGAPEGLLIQPGDRIVLDLTVDEARSAERALGLAIALTEVGP